MEPRIFISGLSLGSHSELANGEGAQAPESLGGLESGLVGGQGLADSASLLGPQVKGLVLLALVELPQVLLLLLGHHDVNAGNGLTDHADLGELGGGPTGDLDRYRYRQMEW